MKHLIAKSDEQLGMCLRMLHEDKLTEIRVSPIMNERHKVEFHVILDDIDDTRFEKLRNRYEMLTF